MNKKQLIVAWGKFCFYVLFFVIVGLLLGLRHYIWATLLLAFGIAFLFFIEEKHIRESILEELSWISEALIDKRWLKDRERESGFYNFILNSLSTGEIKIGMTIIEIAKVIEKEDKRLKEEGYINSSEYYSEHYNYLYFNKEKENESDTIVIHGFGSGIPTPKLILKIKKGKLVGWEEKG